MNEVVPGQVWLRKKGVAALVRRVTAVDGDTVRFVVLHGPASARRRPEGECRLKTFLAHSRRLSAAEEAGEFTRFDGARRHDTFLMLDTAGDALLRCSAKKARLYLRKGFAREVRPGVLQFTDDTTERKLHELHGADFGSFFVAVKNDRCVCCGREGQLSRHHVVPRRHKRAVPMPWRACLSNVLFVCLDCHGRYEAVPEPMLTPGDDWRGFVTAWRDHFLAAMRPAHLPAGWDIVSVENLEAVRRDWEAGT